MKNMGGRSTSSSTTSLLFKVMFGTLALVGFIFLLLVGNQESGRTTFSTQSGGNFKQVDMGREKLVDHPELDLNYMSKRRVPNGPDPIHNRYIYIDYNLQHIHRVYIHVSFFFLICMYVWYICVKI